MSIHHYCLFLRRRVCVGLVILAISLIHSFSALAAEDGSKAVKTSVVSAGERDFLYHSTAPSGEVVKKKTVKPDPLPKSEESEPVFATPSSSNEILVDGFVLPVDNEIYELVLELNRKKTRFASTVIGLQQGFNNYIPLIEIGRNVRFDVNANLAEETVSGFFIKEENTYSLDVKSGTYSVRGKTFDFPENSIIVRNVGQGLGDIYVTPELINEIWPLDIELDQSELSINILTPLNLPRDLEIERERKRNKIFGRDDVIDELSGLDLQYVKNNYRAFSLPVLNINDNVVRNNRTNEVRNVLGLSGRSDLLGFSANYNTSIEFKGQDTPEVKFARARFERKNLSGYDLPWGLQKVEWGDIASSPSEFVSSSITGRGLSFSNAERTRPTSFDEITVEGFAEPDWEVEVYRGNKLLDFGIVDERGEYRFENIPLIFGANQIRVVLYGPQGQIEERIESHPISGNMLLPGKTEIQGSFLDTNEELIRVNDSQDRLAQGLTSHLRVDHGINKWISAFGTIIETPFFQEDISRDPGTEIDKRYYTAGATVSALGGIGQVELYKEEDGGNAADFQYANKFAGIRYNLRSALFNDFNSKEVGFGNEAKTFEGEVRLNTRLDSDFLGNYGLNFEYLREKFENGTLLESYDTGISTSLSPKLRVSHDTSTQLLDKKHTSSTGVLNFDSRLSPQWNLRSILTYDIFPEKELSRANLNLRYRPKKNERLTASFDASRNVDIGENSLAMSTTYDFEKFLGTFRLAWEEDDGVNYGIRASTSLGPFGDNNEYIASSTNLTNNKTVKSHVFLDENMDGIYNGNDQVIPDAKILVNNRRSRDDEADEDGYIFIENAGTEGLAVLRVDEDSMSNQLFKGAIDGYKTVLRSVEPNPIFNLPVVMTGIIDGAVYLANGEPAPGVRLQLVNAKGAVSDETITSFDGFYIFEFVRPGTYHVQVDPTQQVYTQPRFVEVTSTDLFAYGVDLRLLEQAGEVSAAEEADRDHGRIALYHAPVADGVLQPAPVSSDGVSMATVRQVRIGEYPGKVRLVLDLSAPAEYELKREGHHGEIFTIELPNTGWDDSNAGSFNNPYIKGYTAQPLPGGGTKLMIEGNGSVQDIYDILLPPAPKYHRGHRLVIDLAPAQ